MSFQITDSNNCPIPYDVLDKEAAEFWNVPLNSQFYASPFIHKSFGTKTSWYDIIGSCISKPLKEKNPCAIREDWGPWNVVKSNVYLTVCLTLEDLILYDNEDVEKTIVETITEFTAPYLRLILHWKSMGYLPRIDPPIEEDLPKAKFEFKKKFFFSTKEAQEFLNSTKAKEVHIANYKGGFVILYRE